MIDQAKADHVLAFVRLLKDPKGGSIMSRPCIKWLPWQEKFFADIFATVNRDGTRQYREAFVEIPRKNGKALWVDTPIPTPSGWRTMGELAVGDEVFGADGKPTRITYKSPVYTDHDCYEVVFEDGETLIADGDHRWMVETRDSRRSGRGRYVVTTAQMAGNFAHARSDGKGSEYKYRVPTPAPVEYSAVDLPLDPYVFGAWLGDGYSHGNRVTVGDGDLIEMLRLLGGWARRAHRYTSAWAILLGQKIGRSNTVLSALRSMGVLGAKHIPRMYLESTREQRFELLRGLMDTDGYVSRAGQCEFVQKSKRMIDDFSELLASLGIKHNVRRKRARCNGVDAGDVYSITFFVGREEPCFKLRRKVERLKPSLSPRMRNKSIVSIRPVPSVPVQCIQVDNADHLYLAGRKFTVTHNTTTIAACVVYQLFCSPEYGQEIYSAANDRDQAALVFNMAASMIRANPALKKRCTIYDATKRIVRHETESFYKALSRESATAHGLNPSFVIYDELHEAKNRDLYDVLKTGMGARREPLFVTITTAGTDLQSLCYELYQYGKKIQSGEVKDPTFYPLIFEADPEDDIWDERIWRKANPSAGAFRDLTEIRSYAERAKVLPTLEVSFRHLYLNQWVQNLTRWIRRDAWNKTAGVVRYEDLLGRKCYAGLDLGSTDDFCALVLVFPSEDGTFDVLPFFWIPEARLSQRRKGGIDLVPWVRAGVLEATPGEVTDYNFILRRIEMLRQDFEIREIAFDRWGAAKLRADIENALSGSGTEMVQFGQGFASMSPPSKELERLILERGIRHGNHPVLDWMADNVVVRLDPAGNIKPDKEKSPEKIDGIVALVMALDRAVRWRENQSIYETRAPRVIRL